MTAQVWTQSIVRKAFTYASLGILLYGLSVLHNQITHNLVVIDSEDQASPLLHPKLFPWLTFGQLPAAVDLLLIQYLGDDHYARVTSHSEKKTKAFTILDLATEMDPAYLPFYTSGASVVSVVRGDHRGALQLLERGENYRLKILPTRSPEFRNLFWPDHWRIPMLLGYLNLYEFNNYSEALVHFHDAGAIAGAPAYFARLGDRLHQRLGPYELGLRILRHIFDAQKDPAQKAAVEKKIAALVELKTIQILNLNFSAIKKRTPQQSDPKNLQAALQLPEVQRALGEIAPFNSNSPKLINDPGHTPATYLWIDRQFSDTFGLDPTQGENP